MPSLRDPSFLKSVKGKVLLGFFVTSLALAASWVISKAAFKDMLKTLEVVSEPSEKLQLVNKVFKNILQLDQLQNQRAVKGDTSAQQFLTQSSQLIAYLDTLTLFCIDNPLQIVRLDSMKKILKERENTYSNYVKVRSRLVSNKALSEEVKSISGLITTNKLKPDSTVVKTEKRTTTTTLYTETQAPPVKQEEVKKGFLTRMFGSKKNKQPVPPPPAKIIQEQQVNVQVDTLTVAQENHTIEKVGEAVKAIETSQRIRTDRFIDREQELATAGNSLIRQLLRVMQEVERDLVKQSNSDGSQAQKMVAKSISRLEYVMMGFFFLTALLAYLIFTDIAKSNQYKSQLEEAKEEAEYHSMAKQRFLSNMSHEIRTPLQSIIGYTEALKKAERPEPQDLETLHAASEHLLYLVNDVLDYNRIISNQFTFEERTFAVSPLLTEVIQMLRPTISSKSLLLSLENTLPGDLYLKGDPFRIRQVLYNLLTNAIKFTEKGEVILKAGGVESKRGFKLEFQVSDTGIGLSEDQINRVFNQFEQADPSIARKYGGSGLGLSIVKSLVEQMSGTIKVLSKPGEGTTFVVNTLLQKAEAPIATVKDSDHITRPFKGKVWLVDDDAFILKWCSSVLQTQEIQHRTFSSAEEALNHPWEKDVTVVLTDMRMPGMNGAELCSRLRKNVSGQVKFYVLTAQALPEERAMLMKLGFDGILMKPFHSHELLKLLDENNPEPIHEDSEMDFVALGEMTFGDESLLREILEQFVKDMRTDVGVLQRNISMEDYENVAEVVHKLAGRTGQIGIRNLSEKLRKAEIALRKGDRIAINELNELTNDTIKVIDQVEEKVLSYSI
jgi:signal transduction histidine kinase/FixJ family two-component response regulator